MSKAAYLYLQIASQVSFKMRLTVDLPIRKLNESETCCSESHTFVVIFMAFAILDNSQ